MLDTSRRTAFSAEHEQFRDSVRRFFDARADPPSRPLGGGRDHRPRLLDQGGRGGPALPDRARGIWRARPRFRLQRGRSTRSWPMPARPPASRSIRTSSPIIIVALRLARSRSSTGCRGMVSGETATAIAMTEPGAGSDLQGIRPPRKRDGNHYVAQRLQDLHHQRPACRPRHRRRQDRSEPRAPRASR